MKYFVTLLRVCLICTFILVLIYPTILLANDQNTKQVSLRERVMNAAQQLREYHHRVAIETRKLKERGISALPASVSLRIENTLKTSSTIFFKDDMESGLNGWTTEVFNGSDIWHQTTSDANSPTHSWWAGVELQGNYNTGSRINTALISPPINLTTATGPIQLLFTENYVTEAGWDFCMVDISTDNGVHWTHLRGGYGSAPSGDSYGWILSSLNLSAYAGQTIVLRFYFDTGDSLLNDFPGWFIDNVVVFDQGGMITGKTFFDVNQNGIKDNTDRGVKDWLVTAVGEGITITTKTNYRGKYWLPLPLGSYTITDEQKPGWTQTFPTPFPSHWNITMSTPDTLVDSVWFGNFTNASFINGTVFNDVNNDSTYNAGTDSLQSGWRVILSDTLGNMVDYDYTDSLGSYQLFIFQQGKYVVSEAPGKLHSGWVETYPKSETYTIDIPDLSTIINGKDFGNYWSPLSNAVMGRKFNDRNRNHVFDPDEQGVSGFTIQLIVKNNEGKTIYNKKRITDSSGYYQFMGVPAGVCDVSEVIGLNNIGWWQSYPPTPYSLVLNVGQKLDSVDFGNYEIAPGSISGMKFNDLDTNGTKDQGEPGLSGWTIMLSGVTFYGNSVSTSVITNQSGNYNFSGLWPGKYSISEVMRSNWKQTYPTNLKPHFINLGPEANLTDIDFGNTLDSSFSMAFRTFTMEELANAVDQKNKHLPILPKPDKDKFSFKFFVDSLNTQALIILFGQPVDTTKLVKIIPPIPSVIVDLKLKKWTLTWNGAMSFNIGDSIIIEGWLAKPKLQSVVKFRFRKFTLPECPWRTDVVALQNDLCYPMPNAVNLLSAGAGTGLRVGLGGPHTVLHKTYKDVIKSLWEKPHGMHIGAARCLDKFTNHTSIKRQQSYLTPTRGQNKLFAEAIALQANINGSDYGILPGGFGNLIFNEGVSNPMNELPIRTIAAALDTFMSSYKDADPLPQCQMPFFFTGMDVESLWVKVRMINGAFSGPIDTISFKDELKFKPVHPLSAVPFLHLDSSFIQMGTYALKQIPPAIPEQFTLHQNYPNPFNPSTIIEFYIPEQSFVSLKIYNTLGQEVTTLIDHQEMESGTQEIELSSTAVNLSSGIYYYRLVAEVVTDEGTPGQKFVSTKKMVLLK